jgi:hypothetical protein
MRSRLTRFAAANVAVLSAALMCTSGAGAATTNEKIPADEFPAADLCTGEAIQLQGTLHFVQEGEFVADAPRQHVSAHLNSQRLTGIGLTSGDLYNVDIINNNLTNSRVDGADVTTNEVMMNVVRRGSEANSQIQTVLHFTFNANGDGTAAFQNFHVHCQSDA